MYVKNISGATLAKVVDRLGFEPNRTEIRGYMVRGPWCYFKPARKTPAHRIVQFNGNWYIADVEYTGKTAKSFRAVTIFSGYGTQKRPVRMERALGNLDWYNLICALLKRGAVVKVLDQTFHNREEYSNWIQAKFLEFYITFEQAIRRKYNAAQRRDSRRLQVTAADVAKVLR